MINFPDFISEYLEENFIPYYKSYIYCLENHKKVNWTIQTIKRKDISELPCPKDKKESTVL